MYVVLKVGFRKNLPVLLAGQNTTQVQYGEVFPAPEIVGKETVKIL